MIIGFVGRAGSGKNTAATRLAQMIDKDVEFVAFADKLKESAAAIFGIHDPEIWNVMKNDDDFKIELVYTGEDPFKMGGKFLTVREFLQRYGTEAHREIFGTDFWVNQALDYTPTHRNWGGITMVTDVRFDNEVQGIHDRGGVVIEIEGANDPDITEATHPSELPLEGADFLVDNTILDDNFEELDNQLWAIADKLGLPLREDA